MPGPLERDRIRIPGDYQYRAANCGPRPQRFWHHLKICTIERLLAPEPGIRLLDVGCGSGVLTEYLAAKGVESFGLDLNPEAVSFASHRRFAKGPWYVCSSALELSFQDKMFDAACCFEVLEHLYVDQARQVLQEIFRVLRTGGRLAVTTPNYRSPWPILERTLDAMRLVPPLEGVQHVQRFTRRSLFDLVAQAGLQPVSLGRGFGIAPFLSLLSWRLALAVDRAETKVGNPVGNLLAGVWMKP